WPGGTQALSRRRRPRAPRCAARQCCRRRRRCLVSPRERPPARRAGPKATDWFRARKSPWPRSCPPAQAASAVSSYACGRERGKNNDRSEEHTSELQSRENLVCRLLLEKKKYINTLKQ